MKWNLPLSLKTNFRRIIILLLFYTTSYGDTLHIYLNTFTCKSCNVIGKQLEKYSLHKFLYLTENDYDLKEEILASYNLRLESFEVRKIQNDFFGVNQRSYCILQKGSRRSEKFLLGDFSQIRDFQVKSDLKKRTLQFDPAIRISDAAILTVSGHYLQFYDFKINRVYIASRRNDSIILLQAIKGNDFPEEEFMKCKCFDASLYLHLKPLLRELNLLFPEIESSHIKDNKLNIMLGFNTGLLTPATPDTIINKRLFIYQKDLINGKSSIVCLNADGIVETDRILGTKFSLINHSFIRNADTLYIPIVTSDSVKKSLFAKQLVEGYKVRNLGITRDLAKEVPPGLRFMFGAGALFFSREVNETDHFFLKAPLVYNFSSKRTNFINNSGLLERLRDSSAYISDARTIRNEIRFLLKSANSWFIECYDIESNRLLSSSTIDVNPTITSIVFLGDNSFLAYSPVSREMILLEP